MNNNDIRYREWLNLNTLASKCLKSIIEAENILMSLDDYQQKNNQCYPEIEDLMLKIGDLRRNYTKYMDEHEEIILLKYDEI